MTKPVTRRSGRGFTLTEMIIVIGVITLLMAIAMPSFMQIFSSGAEAQAYNIVSSQLTVARSYAIQNSVYAGVHVQMGDAQDKWKAKQWSAVVWYDPTRTCGLGGDPRGYRSLWGGGVSDTGWLGLVEGYPMQAVPGNVAFGEADNNFHDGTNFNVGAELRDFSAFTVLFSPQGSLSKTVPHPTDGNNYNIRFDCITTDGGEWNDAFNATDADKKIWSEEMANELRIGGSGGIIDPSGTAVSEYCVFALAMFDYRIASAKAIGARDAYLFENSRPLPIHPATGQLFERQ